MQGVEQLEPAVNDEEDEPAVFMNPVVFRETADLLRSIAPHVGPEWQEQLQRKVRFLGSAEAALQGAVVSCSQRELQNMLLLMRCVLLAGDLKDGHSLTDSLRLAMKIALPAPAASAMEAKLQAHQTQYASRIPSSATLYRHRCTLLWGHILLLREAHEALLRSIPDVRGGIGHRKVVRWTMVDSSPQGHVDYVLSCYRQVPVAHLAGLFQDVLDLHDERMPCGDKAASRHRLAKALELKTGVPSAVGSGKSATAYKLHALVHSIRMESKTWSSTCQTASSSVSVTTDLGVEYNIAAVAPFYVQTLFAWARDKDAPEERERERESRESQSEPERERTSEAARERERERARARERESQRAARRNQDVQLPKAQRSLSLPLMFKVIDMTRRMLSPCIGQMPSRS